MSIQSTAQSRASRMSVRNREEAFGPKPGTPIEPNYNGYESPGRRSRPVFGKGRGGRVFNPEKSAPGNVGVRQVI